jgi:hypothetical protein
MQMLLSGLTPAIFIPLGNEVARRFNLSGIFWFHGLGICGRGNEYESPNHNRQERRPHHFALTSFLADQQNKCSGSYQHRNQDTDDERGNPMPTLNGLRPSAFLRCSDA